MKKFAALYAALGLVGAIIGFVAGPAEQPAAAMSSVAV